jgi:hypothetical protein
MVNRVNARSGDYIAADRERNARVLNQAKQALIGYVVAQAAKGMPFPEDNPGALPCPEHPWYIGLPDKEGGAGPSIGVSNPGYGTANCSSIGRFPWRTIGTPKLVDASGEPLWYVVGPTWRKTSSSTKTDINSNTPGDLTVDGQQAVALIIAPGPAMSTQAGTTAYGAACSARAQTRLAPAGSTLNALDYLECFDSVALQFSTGGPSGSFNDQAVMVTAADLMPGIEAAVADRMSREVVPALKSVYGSATWSLTSSNPLYPYAAPFAGGGVTPSSSTYAGTSGTYAGLLPFNSQSCSGDPRCTTIVAWKSPVVASVAQTGGTGTLQVGTSCSFLSATQVRCTGTYLAAGATQLTMSARASNVAMGLRALDATQMTAEYLTILGWTSVTSSASGAFLSDGSADVKATATFPSLLSLPIGFRITINLAALTDHALLSSTDPTTGWFVRNEWYRLLYYAVARGYTADVLATPKSPACPTSTASGYAFDSSCLTVTNVTPNGAQRAILILAGRSINASARPSANLGDYFEFGNATGNWERQTVSAVSNVALKRPFNDRVIVLDTN